MDVAAVKPKDVSQGYGALNPFAGNNGGQPAPLSLPALDSGASSPVAGSQQDSPDDSTLKAATDDKRGKNRPAVHEKVKKSS